MSNLRLVLWLILVLYSQFSFSIDDSHLDQLYQQANRYIATRPTESSISINKVWQKYLSIEKKFVGEENLNYNHDQLRNNQIFAKTRIFESSTADLIIESNIKFIRLSYTTQGHNVSGLLLLPPSKPKGMILFFHSTISGKLNAPSLQFNEYKAQLLAAIFAANDYIVVAPDYIGLGLDYKSVHPYILYPRMNVNDGRDMLLASMNYLVANKKIAKNSHLRLFVSGYSEGASYALWFSRIYQHETSFANKLNKSGLVLNKTVPIDGAYNLSQVMFPFLLTSQVNDSSNRYAINSAMWGTLLKPTLLINVMLSYAKYSNRSLDGLLNTDFYNLQCSPFLWKICLTNQESMLNVETLTLTPTKNFRMVFEYFLAASFKTGQGIIYSPFFNSVYPLLAEGIVDDRNLSQAIKKADIIDWYSTNPITLISLKNDSVVPEQNSRDAYNGLKQRGSNSLKYIQVDNQLLHTRSIIGTTVIDHVSFEIYGLLIALNEFNQP